VALWVTVIPALLAGLVMRYLVPPVGTGAAGWLAEAQRGLGVYFGVALFLLFSVLTRYWRFRLPGGRYASALPAHIAPGETSAARLAAWERLVVSYERFRSPPLVRRLGRTLAPGARADLDRQLVELRESIESAELRRAEAARYAVETVATSELKWQRRREAVAWLAPLALALSLVLGVRARLLGVYRVGSTSMLPTLEPDDTVAGKRASFANDSGRGLRRGDVIVFRSDAVGLAPEVVQSGVPDELVKRIIGLPGDRIVMNGSVPTINGFTVPSCDAGDYIYVLSDMSGKAISARLHVEFIEDRAYLTLDAGIASPPREYAVAPGHVFVLGDNRQNSLDSRVFGVGGVPLAAIEGRAEWFLTGTHRSGDIDFQRFFRPVDGLESHLRLEGFDTNLLMAGIARCFQSRPTDTRPPPAPPEATVSTLGGV
jgi:signal peptidase I